MHNISEKKLNATELILYMNIIFTYARVGYGISMILQT